MEKKINIKRVKFFIIANIAVGSLFAVVFAFVFFDSLFDGTPFYILIILLLFTIFTGAMAVTGWRLQTKLKNARESLSESILKDKYNNDEEFYYKSLLEKSYKNCVIAFWLPSILIILSLVLMVFE